MPFLKDCVGQHKFDVVKIMDSKSLQVKMISCNPASERTNKIRCTKIVSRTLSIIHGCLHLDDKVKIDTCKTMTTNNEYINKKTKISFKKIKFTQSPASFVIKKKILAEEVKMCFKRLKPCCAETAVCVYSFVYMHTGTACKHRFTK